MHNQLTKEQQNLIHYMSEISEKAYYAGWMEGLEYALWKAIINGPYKYGRYEITKEDIEKLKELSNTCNGWIWFGDDETFISISDWEFLYQHNKDKYQKY